MRTGQAFLARRGALPPSLDEGATDSLHAYFSASDLEWQLHVDCMATRSAAYLTSLFDLSRAAFTLQELSHANAST